MKLKSNIENQNNNKIALLIDADNAKAELIVNMLAEAGKFGKGEVRIISITSQIP